MPKEPENTQKQIFILKQTVKTLATLNSLISDANQCRDEQNLIFHLLNHTVGYIHYDRAILISGTGRKILGISGSSQPSMHSDVCRWLRQLKKTLNNPEEAQIINEDAFSDIPDFWEEYTAKSGGTFLLWLPLAATAENSLRKHNAPPVLVLERWQQKQWQPGDLKLTAPLQKNFGSLLQLHKRKSPENSHKYSRRALILLILVAVILSLYSYKISERIVAPCEIVPLNPVSVTTPIDGVVDEILVHPGDTVKESQTLVKLNRDIFSEEFTAAEQQVKITRSELSRTEAEAITDMDARSRLKALETQLAMDKTRLRIARYKLDKSLINAPAAGVVMMNDPNEWEGKPVMTGERIMLLITPGKNKIKIYLPLADKIDFPENARVKIILNTDSATSRQAHLSYLAEHATTSPTGIPAFLAEATLDWKATDIRMGVQGTAVIYGNKVSLGYWLIRRPLAAIRNFIGI